VRYYYRNICEARPGVLYPVGKNHVQSPQGRRFSLPQFLPSLPSPTMGVVSRPSGVVQNEPISHPPASSESAATSGVPDSDKYVDKLLRNVDPLPPITWSNWHREVRWFNLSVIVVTPLVALYGAMTTHLDARTLWFCAFYFVFNVIGGFFLSVSGRWVLSSNSVGEITGITAGMYTPTFCPYPLCCDVSIPGYHRLWSHRAYNASKPLEYLLAVAGGGSVQGAILWWARGHRSHHRYTDTDLDPYNAERGFWWVSSANLSSRPSTHIMAHFQKHSPTSCGCSSSQESNLDQLISAICARTLSCNGSTGIILRLR